MYNGRTGKGITQTIMSGHTQVNRGTTGGWQGVTGASFFSARPTSGPLTKGSAALGGCQSGGGVLRVAGVGGWGGAVFGWCGGSGRCCRKRSGCFFRCGAFSGSVNSRPYPSCPTIGFIPFSVHNRSSDKRFRYRAKVPPRACLLPRGQCVCVCHI